MFISKWLTLHNDVLKGMPNQEANPEAKEPIQEKAMADATVFLFTIWKLQSKDYF